MALWLKAKRIPSGLAVLIVMSCMVIILMLIGAQIGTSFSGFSQDLPLLQEQLKEQVKSLSNSF